MRSRYRWIIPLCLAGIAVQFSCLTWGLDLVPVRGYGWHPDEHVVLKTIKYMVANRTICADRYDWPTLYFTLVAIPAGIAMWLGDCPDRTLFLLGRVVSALSAVTAVVLVALIAEVLFTVRAAVLAGGFALLNGFTFLCGHYGTPHMLATALGLASLLFATKYLVGSEEEHRYLLPAAALLAGLSIGAQYNGVFWALMLPVAIIARGWRAHAEHGLSFVVRRVSPAILIAAVCVVIGFIIATPGAVLEPGEFYSCVLFQKENATLGPLRVGVRLLPAHADIYGYSNVAVSTGLPAFILVVWGFGAALRARSAHAGQGRCLGVWLVLGLTLLGIAHRGVVPHYAMPIVAGVCILAGVGMDRFLDLLGTRQAVRALGAGVVYGWQAALLMLVIASFYGDTRGQATSWMTKEWPTRVRVGVLCPEGHQYLPTFPPWAEVVWIRPELYGQWDRIAPVLDYCVLTSLYYERWLDFNELAPDRGQFIEALLGEQSGFVVERVFRRPGLQSEYARRAWPERPTGVQTIARNLRRAATLDADPGFASPTIIVMKRGRQAGRTGGL